MSRATLHIAALLVTLGATGCWINTKAPRHAYLAPEVDFTRFDPTPLPGPAARLGAPRRTLLMAVWQNEAPNPVGGLYDHTVYRITPLKRTFFHDDIAVPIWEGCAARLRASGFRVYKDYTDTGNTALIKRPARLAQALLLRGRLTKAVHDQLKTSQHNRGYEAATVAVELELVDLAGKTLWRGVKMTLLKVPLGASGDLLEDLGASLADLLARDAAFKAALGAVPSRTTAGRR